MQLRRAGSRRCRQSFSLPMLAFSSNASIVSRCASMVLWASSASAVSSSTDTSRPLLRTAFSAWLRTTL